MSVSAKEYIEDLEINLNKRADEVFIKASCVDFSDLNSTDFKITNDIELNNANELRKCYPELSSIPTVNLLAWYMGYQSEFLDRSINQITIERDVNFIYYLIGNFTNGYSDAEAKLFTGMFTMSQMLDGMTQDFSLRFMRELEDNEIEDIDETKKHAEYFIQNKLDLDATLKSATEEYGVSLRKVNTP